MTDLTDRMRTCAAMLAAEDFTKWRIYENETQDRLIRSVESLLIEAAEELEKPIEARLGEPMAVIEPPPPNYSINREPQAFWVNDGLKSIPNAPASKNACPSCDSRASKIVQVHGKSLHLTCPVCGHSWFR